MFRLSLLFAVGCVPAATDLSSDVDPCDGPGALATCLEPTLAAEHYVEQSDAYFDSMDYTTPFAYPPYHDTVARWEWPPWLKLTAFTRDNIEATDALLQFYPSVVRERDCRFFDTQPFGRCYVVFYYDAHEGRPCPIYEEFTFNDAGEITFIEAWSDVDGLRPMADDDPWAEAPDFPRLANRVPGLGWADGAIDVDSPAFQQAAAVDADLADFDARARDWTATWLDEFESSDASMWSEGCGW
jgi:hypothetical protein